MFVKECTSDSFYFLYRRLFVFIALYFVKAGYGIFRTASWGVAISNKLAWILMEAPVFVVMCVMWIYSERRFEPVVFTFFLFFQIHYFQRAFIFPLLLKGKSKMPLAIMSMGVLFNLLNGYMQGKWIFYLAPETMYQADSRMGRMGDTHLFTFRSGLPLVDDC